MIHPSAIIHPGARLGANVTIGPYSIIGEHVEIGDNTVVGPHVVISGRTRIGCDNRIFQFCSLGEVPQDKKYSGEPTCLEIGDRNTIREFCTFNLGTAQDVGITRVGDDNWIMAYVHIAHDCQVGKHTVFANNAQLAGHVHVDDWAILGGYTGVHQFCRIGAHAMTAVGTVVLQDIPPFVMAAGNTASPFGINAEGLKRRGFSADALLVLKRAYRTVYKSGLMLEEARSRLEQDVIAHPEIRPLVDFLAVSKRGIIR
ncbi:MAG TPA: acyl-ACP--UDP-N-acetylglucosamine O-acyltransferase [Accumulibacter sp.]|uniref:acyl-ACP--UDP-N-acetylglucosamine O-acyltransferase n=1 Tax=Accumulibacter sp. TaxID=2053492 RepID=UPI00287877E8|nr:acyl-ACP--UDP-N-acetylglucosamine O-acyltransferase [Accumulibacter sp.]MDS4053431.1 acyl-ACP--UDP-N-acetylglucosamine O-acyltransferase [Accumulibacter sp.]HMV04898.1 acyl-ACP--UDP-N-acetylglucosamine O-acyltransferase [Accumulibacter sp.]HMW62697.1 acyl-ACP--UDP-N-acetylglucosamine O-acyltransferase [Accumulibacter sp.]HMW79478.1 acyl-ACP--UDP-N-acetylglucosamine O-acyltransferase [Accumulibacter sp.]HMX68323.1 acyl-ACP--UDP-N-acetylglucosamine O-acyltransferase [Accumulibacter sp.]